MKRFLPMLALSLILLAAALALCACGGDPGGAEETVPGTSDESARTDGTEPGDDPEVPTEASTEPVTEVTTEWKEERTEMDVFGSGYNAHMLVGFDEQGHLIDAVSSEREGHEVGIFYFLWLGQPFASDIYDVSKILEEYGKDAAFHQESEVSPNNQAHWWAEPLWGYYNSSDEFVIRKHMELLIDAGVDFLVFDTTNAVTYDNVAKRVMKVVTELREEGWQAPQVVFYTHSLSIRTVTNLYNNIYSQDVYPEAWYRVDGKPMIIGYRTVEGDLKEAAERSDTSYHPQPLPQEILDFFYWREPRWPYDNVVENGWPYTEWAWPQPLNTDMVSVSIATHPMVPFSFSLTHDNWHNWGRGYDPRTKENVHDDIMKGTFFDWEWQTVEKYDPRFVFVTGWNEWIAYKQPYGGEYMLCDNVDMEYSRDAEPMMGGYEDAYFIQTAQKVRSFKFEPLDGKLAAVTRKSIDPNGALSQWDDVNAVYRRVGRDDGSRNSYGGAKTVRYENDAVRNNILEVRVTNDAENVYFLITCEENVVCTDTSDWMNLFIGRGRPAMNKGWEGYEYAVNRARAGGAADIERLNADYTGEKVGEAVVTVSGKSVVIAVPRALLGLDPMTDLYFKAADGVDDPTEIMSYYASGRALPMGRMSYLYQLSME